MWDALSDERTVCHLPESQSAAVSLLSVCTVYILHVIKRMYICMYKCMYIQYIQGVCQSRLSTANHALLLIRTSEETHVSAVTGSPSPRQVQ
jgi:hypothetical protein